MTKELTTLEQTVLNYLTNSIEDYIADGRTLGIPASLIASRLGMTMDRAMGIVGSLVKKGIVFTNKTSSGIILIGLRDGESLEALEKVLLESLGNREEDHQHSDCCNDFHQEALTENDRLLAEVIFVNKSILRVLKDPAIDQQKLVGICGGNLEGTILITEEVIGIAKQTPELLGDLSQELILSYEILESLYQGLGYIKGNDASIQCTDIKSVEFSIDEMEALKILATKLVNFLK